MLEINFLAGSKYLLPSVKVGSKTNILGSKIWWSYNSPLAICTGGFQVTMAYAFDRMELFLVLQTVIDK